MGRFGLVSARLCGRLCQGQLHGLRDHAVQAEQAVSGQGQENRQCRIVACCRAVTRMMGLGAVSVRTGSQRQHVAQAQQHAAEQHGGKRQDER